MGEEFHKHLFDNILQLWVLTEWQYRAGYWYFRRFWSYFCDTFSKFSNCSL